MKKTYFNRTFYLLCSLICLTGYLFISACNFGPPENSRAAQAEAGHALFTTYCETCHGPNADQTRVDSLKTEPAKLSQIKARRGAVDFPVQEIAKIIDGRKLVESHGDREMPFWGDVFAAEGNDETEIKGKMAEIIAYLMSIQE